VPAAGVGGVVGVGGGVGVAGVPGEPVEEGGEAATVDEPPPPHDASSSRNATRSRCGDGDFILSILYLKNELVTVSLV
jgi:hypothetical protein